MDRHALRPILNVVTRQPSRLVVYGSVIVLVALAVLAQRLTPPPIVGLFPFATHFLAVLACALLGGWRPAILAWALLAFLTWFTGLGDTSLGPNRQALAFAFYSVTSLIVIGLVELSRGAALRLRRGEARLATALEASRMGTWRYAAATRELVGDAMFKRIWGLAEGHAQFTPDQYLSRILPEDRERVQRHLDDCARNWTDFDLEFRITTPDGGVRWVYGRGKRIDKGLGSPAGECFGVLSDITRRRELEEEARRKAQALHEAEALFRTAQEMSLDGFALLRALRDDSGTIVDFQWDYANPMSHRLLHKPPGSLTGRRLSEVLRGYRDQGLFQRFVHVVETGDPFDSELYYNADGIDGYFHAKATKLGERVVAQFSDITARKREEAARAARLEGRKLLLQELNHRTKNSLQLIAALVHLQAARSGNDLVKEHLEQVRQRIMTIAAIHTRLYRDEDEDREINLLDIREYLQQLCDMIRSSLLERSGRITITLDAAPVKMHLDLVIPLGIILNELVTNALKYAFPDDRAGTIAVSFGEVADGWRLAVTDDGVGSTRRAGGGDGTGRRMVEALARQVGGRLEDLPGPGHGTALWLPADEVRQWQEAESRQSAP